MQERDRLRVIGFFEEAAVAPDTEAWLSQLEAATLLALDVLGSATATELTRKVPGLAQQIRVGIGRRWEGTIGVSTRLLFLLAAEGRIVRGRSRGSWISSQYRWARLDRWIPAGLADWETGAARSELVRHWLMTFGPGTGRRSQVVDRLDPGPGASGARRRRSHRGRSRRPDRDRAARRPRAHPDP